MYYGGVPIYHEPGCRKDLENSLLHSDGTQATSSFSVVCYNTQKM